MIIVKNIRSVTIGNGMSVEKKEETAHQQLIAGLFLDRLMKDGMLADFEVVDDEWSSMDRR